MRPKKRSYNIGMIGFGGFGQFLYNAWQDLPQVNIAAIADSDPDRTKKLKSIRTHVNWRNLADDPDIDIVVIATPPGTHKEIGVNCLEAGKHLLIEKPLALTIEDARAIIQARDRYKMNASIDFIMRYNPLLQLLKTATRNGLFGQLRRVDVENYAQDEQLPPDHWFWDPGRSGGILVEHGVHFIDLVHWLSPVKYLSVQGMRHERRPGQEDRVMANVLYEDGLIATHFHSFSRPGFFEDTRIKLAYDLADIELQGWIPLKASVKALVDTNGLSWLESNHFWNLHSQTPIHQVSDKSRPTGWGAGPDAVQKDRTTRSSGIEYRVTELVTGELVTGRSKQDVYKSCVRDSLLDLIRTIEDPSHPSAAPLEAGIEALDIALRAGSNARREKYEG